jgi:hypothetical protein
MRLEDYIAHGRQTVGGWLARIDAEILGTILKAQDAGDLKGSVAEIGVHHGKTFILLCHGLKKNERAYCVDIFDMQHLNKDNSGLGNRAIFERNLKRFGIADSLLAIEAKSSEDVTAGDIIANVGQVRLFSVDGGHWLDIVANDMRIAEDALALYGVIALDDFHRPEWPEVSAAYFQWFASRRKPIVPFAIGFNKLYLCETEWLAFYQNALIANSMLQGLVVKNCQFQGVRVPVYQACVVPEDGLRGWLRSYFRVFRPEKFANANRVLNRNVSGKRTIRRSTVASPMREEEF